MADRRYDVFAHYAVVDFEMVQSILQYLESVGLNINDPHRDSTPGAPVLTNLFDNGISRSQNSLVFLSKDFPVSALERFQTNSAMCADANRNHRVILVTLKSCKIPSHLRAALRIFAWKYENNKDAVHQKIIAALNAPVELSRSVWRKAIKSVDVQSQTLLVQRPRLVFSCVNSKCAFQCPWNQFYRYINHLLRCKFKRIACTNVSCCQVVEQRRLGRHRRRCRYRPVQCRTPGCGKVVEQRRLKGHKQFCKDSSEKVVFTNSSKTCQMAACTTCRKQLRRLDLPSHRCPFSRVKCPFCANYVKRKDMSLHTEVCSRKADHAREPEYTSTRCQICSKIILAKDMVEHMSLSLSEVIGDHFQQEKVRRLERNMGAEKFNSTDHDMVARNKTLSSASAFPSDDMLALSVVPSKDRADQGASNRQQDHDTLDVRKKDSNSHKKNVERQTSLLPRVDFDRRYPEELLALTPTVKLPRDGKTSEQDLCTSARLKGEINHVLGTGVPDHEDALHCSTHTDNPRTGKAIPVNRRTIAQLDRLIESHITALRASMEGGRTEGSTRRLRTVSLPPAVASGTASPRGSVGTPPPRGSVVNRSLSCSNSKEISDYALCSIFCK